MWIRSQDGLTMEVVNEFRVVEVKGEGKVYINKNGLVPVATYSSKEKALMVMESFIRHLDSSSHPSVFKMPLDYEV